MIAPTKHSSQEFLLLHKSSFRLSLHAAGILLLVLLLIRASALPQLSSSYIGGFEGDGGLYIWLTQWNLSGLFSLPWFNTKAFYPYTRSLAWSDSYILPSLAAWPLVKLGASLALAFNLIILIANFLNGFLTYRLAYALTGKQEAALFAGISFMSLSSLTYNLGHPQLQFAFWLPLACHLFLMLLRAWSWRCSISLGLTIFLSFLCAAYYALFIALTLSALLAALLLVRRISGDKVAWAKGALGVLVGLSPILAVLPPYLDTRATFGERELYEPHYFSASLLSYLSSPAQNLLYGFSAAFSHDEAHLSPGLLILVLCLIGFFRVTDAKVLRIFAAAFLLALLLAGLLAIPQVPGEIANYACALSSWAALFCFCLLLWRLGNIELKLGFKIVTNRDLLSIFMFCAVLSFLISLGPQGNPNKGHLALGVHRLFYEVLPGFNSIRAISRIGIFCLFFLVMCSSLVIAQLQSKKILNTALVSLLSLAVFLENYTYSFPLSTAKPRPAIFEQLARIGNSGDALVVLPFTSELDGNRQVKSWGDFAAKNTSYMNWLSGSGRPLVNGYSGQRTKIMSEFPAHLSNFPDQRSLTSLGSIVGLRYVILLSSLIHNFNPDSFRDRVEMFSHAFRYIYGDSEGHHLFEFVAIRTITDSGFHLLAPSYPRGLVSLELMTHKQDSAEPIAVSVYNKEHFGGSPIAVLKLVPDGNWSLLSFLTPETPDRVRPLRLTFRAESEVFIRHSSYEALGSAFSSE